MSLVRWRRRRVAPPDPLEDALVAAMAAPVYPWPVRPSGLLSSVDREAMTFTRARVCAAFDEFQVDAPYEPPVRRFYDWQVHGL